MNVLLLVAGQSKRFWPLTEKSLLPICGKTFLEWQLVRLREAGLTKITVVTNPGNEAIVRALAPDVPVLVQEDMTLGTRGALLTALNTLPPEPVMVVAGTDLVEASAYRDVLAAAKRPGVDGVFLAKEMETYFPGGYLTMQSDRIVDIVEKPGEGKQPSNLVNIIVHVHNDLKALADAMQQIPDLQGDGYSQTEQILLKTKHYSAVTYRGSWQAMKYPWYALFAMEQLLGELTESSVHPSAVIHPSAVLEGTVVIEEGVMIGPHAVIMGPATIGKHTVIGSHVVIRQSSIGAHCAIGARSEVKGSVIAGFTKTHGCYLGDSVLGENINVATGCVTGNLRFDEHDVLSMVGGVKISTGRRKFGAVIGSGCRLGIQVGMQPGVKIGSDTFVSGHCLLTEDIPAASFVSMKNGALRIIPNTSSTPHFAI